MAMSVQQRAVPVVVKPIRWGRLAAAAIAIVLLLGAALLVAQSQNVQWGQVPAYLFDRSILSGIVLTLELTAAAMAVGIVLGALLAAMALSGSLVLSGIAAGFIWAFRGVPLIVQIFFWFNIALFVPDLHFSGVDISINDIVTPPVAGLLALGLHEAANMAEVIRSGLLSVDTGQHEASRALGLTRGNAMRSIILPQAIRVIIPPTGNQAIGMLKASAIVSVIGMEELLTQAQHIYARNFLVIELLIVASIWYLALTSIATVGQHYLERYFSRGFGRRRNAPARRVEQQSEAEA